MEKFRKYWRLLLVAALIATAAFGLGYQTAKRQTITPIIIEQKSS